MADVAPIASEAEAGPARERASFFGSRTVLKSPNERLQPEMAPPPPAKPPKKRHRSALSTISGFFTFLVVAVFAAIIGLVVGSERLHAPGPLKTDALLVIPPRTDVPDILDRLEKEGVIDNQLLMNFALFAEGTRSKLKAGEYVFKQEASLQDVIDTLVGGHSVLHSFTIPEGLTSEQIIGRLRDQELLENDVKDLPKEGALMPDTYKFARGETREKQVAKMVEAQKKVLAEVWSRRAADLPLKSPFELVTLASIVERETGKADERPRVAGVFINRLNRGMQLQSDPTIVYGLIGGKGSLGHPITREELNKPTPYNTYQIKGLPPGPIGNPGRAAMEAVANPSRTQELFFVADGTGGHVFAETLDQHNRNVVRWRQIEKDAKDKLAPDAEKTLAPGKPLDQKGELVLPPAPFATLPTAFADVNDATGPASEALARLANAMAAPGISKPATAPPAFAGPVMPDLSAVDIALQGDDAPIGDLNAYPVSATRRAEQKVRAARFGLAAGSDVLPDTTLASAPVVEPLTTTAPKPRARAFDASEGTSLDPLRNKSFDLTSAKTVPNLR